MINDLISLVSTLLDIRKWLKGKKIINPIKIQIEKCIASPSYKEKLIYFLSV